MWFTDGIKMAGPVLSFLLCCASPAYAAPVSAEAQVVAHLYKDFGWQAFATQSELFGESLEQQRKDVLARFFSAQLVELLVRDAECEAREKGLCRLDFDILFDSQDPVVTDLKIQMLAPGKVLVDFTNPVNGERTAIRFVVTNTSGQWRIVDVLYGQKPERSLKQTLLKR
ncbi:DUF3828 domain-containing protein [Pseudoduganella eburnea]|uniref:DUF3828 domain-containing protein n=1 Tax=Massilia eburnea TaxID=1776165 RepID=A0A6L6QMJ9_9BURK|nr:DUF3828 domain-containing protein [Massilia eburnea]MTW12926.1 DUF3828 domain-containing protein [Massilia eburnea]